MNIKARSVASATEDRPADALEGEEMLWHPEEVTDEADPAIPSKERKTSNLVLAVLAVFLLAFIVTMIVTFWVKGSVPDTLIQYTMGAGGVEAMLLAGIKVSKVLAGNKPGPDPPDGVG